MLRKTGTSQHVLLGDSCPIAIFVLSNVLRLVLRCIVLIRFLSKPENSELRQYRLRYEGSEDGMPCTFSLFGLPVDDTACGTYAFKKELWKNFVRTFLQRFNLKLLIPCPFST